MCFLLLPLHYWYCPQLIAGRSGVSAVYSAIMPYPHLPAYRPAPRAASTSGSANGRPLVCAASSSERPNARSRQQTGRTRRTYRHPNPNKHTQAIMSSAQAGDLSLLESAINAARADDYHLNVVNYTAIANAHVVAGNPADAFNVFAEMRKRNVAPSNATLRVASKAVYRMTSVRSAADALLESLNWARHAGTFPCVRTWNLCMNSLIARGAIDDAVSILRDMSGSTLAATPVPDACSFNQCITALGRAGRLADALGVFGRLLVGPVPPDVITYNAVLDAALADTSSKSDSTTDVEVSFVTAVRNSMKRRLVSPNVTTETLALRVLSRRGSSSSVTPSVKHFTSSMIRHVLQNEVMSAHLDKPYFDAALTALGLTADMNTLSLTFDTMLAHHIFPDILTLRALLVGAKVRGDVPLARILLNTAPRLGFSPDEYAYTAAIAACAHASPADPKSADDFLRDAARAGMRWSAPMINAAISCHGNDVQNAVSLWKRLSAEGDQCTRDTLTSRVVYDALLRVCGRAGKPDLALRVWYAAKNSNHIAPNSRESRSVFNAFMRGAEETTSGHNVADNLLKRNYLRLLKTECGVKDGFDWPVERIRIKF